jgi:hypothetical protein
MAGAEASAGMWPFDRGKVICDNNFRDSSKSPCTKHLLRMMHEYVPRSKNKSVVVREAVVTLNDCIGETFLEKLTLDTGASNGNYIGRKFVEDNFREIEYEPCHHRVRLGDGESVMTINKTVVLNISLLNDYGERTKPISTEFYVSDSLGDEAIIGLPELLGNYFEFFMHVLEGTTKVKPLSATERIIDELNQICDDFEEELLYSRFPNARRIRKLVNKARKITNTYSRTKNDVRSDPYKREVIQNRNPEQTPEQPSSSVMFLVSEKHGVVYDDNRVESIMAAIELCADHYTTGEVLHPWREAPILCEEEELTPDPVSISDDILRFMEMSVDESRKEYHDILLEHVDKKMLEKCPKIMDRLKQSDCVNTFAPEHWNGIKVAPAVLETLPNMPKELRARARPIKPDHYEHAKKEYNRLTAYFYEKSNSPIASPLVIAPKATAPFIRFCGDYREVNKFIRIPQQPIPIVKHELMKAAKFSVYVDLDMANSFHQIPLSEEFSNLLSVQTPWGLVRPRFLPEGVGPASGLLQSIVRQVFTDFEDWTIVIFDNFLILADDYEDAYKKFDLVLKRCSEYGIVLKMKKSWIGVDTVTFFGYEVTQGKWKLSDSRKAAIADMPFPTSIKSMQSFLGAALFFHNHVPDYSEWSAKLYEMTHAKFDWNPTTWTFDYKAHFERFKKAISEAAMLHFPDYNLPWVVRCDASDKAVGAVLYQEYKNEDGSIEHQAIAFSSKRFTEPASKWDTYKREAYAIFHAVHSFSYYLRGKEFLVETDHRNLQWIETSQTPIVVRWRALLQSYSFLIRHIPGVENKVADWMSRMYRITDDVLYNLEFDDIMKTVHGKEALHFGAAETWTRAKQLFPDAHIPIEAVRTYVKECPMCQKMRNTGIKGLPSQTRTLKPQTYRKRVGIDHISISKEPDKNGNTCAIIFVEHFSHFPQVYAAKDYSAETVVETMIEHFSRFGVFDELISDPGSAFMSDVHKRYTELMGIRHKVSLVGRHESNGCESSGREFIRHLRTLVNDKRLVDRWSDKTVLPLINFALCSHATSETGGITPFALKYGTQDAAHFRLPDGLEPGARSHEVLRRLDQDLQTIRERSLELQNIIVEERKSKDKPPAHYEIGDFVLWNPREKQSDFAPSKLGPNWFGPYEVISQYKNDVTMKHMCIHTVEVQHISRLKPWFGSREEAIEYAKLDHNQFDIRSINYFTGNPHLRSSMMFNVTYSYNNTTEDNMIQYGPDLDKSQQFGEYINRIPYLFPLRYLASAAKKEIRKIRKERITRLMPGDTAYLDLRYFDGETNAWFDSLDLPDKHKVYYVQVRGRNWTSNRHNEIETHCETFGSTIYLNNYDVQALVLTEEEFVEGRDILVTAAYRQQYPKIFQE